MGIYGAKGQADIKHEDLGPTAGKTVIFGFGRVGRMVADMLTEHGRAYLAVDSDIDGFAEAERPDIPCFMAMSQERNLSKLQLDQVVAVVLTMDDPVLTARLAKRLREEHQPAHYRPRARRSCRRALSCRSDRCRAGSAEASLQLSEPCWSTLASRWAQ